MTDQSVWLRPLGQTNKAGCCVNNSCLLHKTYLEASQQLLQLEVEVVLITWLESQQPIDIWIERPQLL